MAALQLRNGGYRLLFQFNGKQHTYPVGPVSLAEARQWKSKVEHLLMRVKQNLLEVPPGCTINQFLQHDGKPPAELNPAKTRYTTLNELREKYVKAFSKGAIEVNTLGTAEIHLDHITETFGKSFLLPALTLAKLQEHVDRRIAIAEGVTIKKEIASFGVAWNWGQRQGYVSGVFPSRGLVYPKSEEKLPFMSWAEIKRRLKAGGDPEKLSECLYLTPEEVTEFLDFAKKANVRDYLYPMLVTFAHAGARRSEAMRSECQDVDLAGSVITLREKKRAKGKVTTRRVPISGLLSEVLAEQLEKQEGKKYLFGNGDVEITDGQAVKAFTKLVTGSKWEVLRGYHILRHAFISALACRGVDQRIIDEFAGHSTEEQRRRYRHLFPKVTQDAITKVFG
jgi:site-specific recombinase XerD